MMTTVEATEDQLLVKVASLAEGKLLEGITGMGWNGRRKAYTFPKTPDAARAISRALSSLETPVEIPAEIMDILEEKRLQMALVDVLKAEGWEDAEPVAEMPITVKPFAHQVLGYNIGITLDNSALLMEQGTGKTLTAISIMGHRFMEGQIQKALVVAPTSVVPVWPKELDKMAAFPVIGQALDGNSAKKKAKQLAALDEAVTESEWPALPVAVINYESAWRMVDDLSAWGPDMIILDESQRIKTPSSKQTEGITHLGQMARYRLILTGTPVSNGPLDFYAQYRFLEPGIFGGSWTAFKSRYAKLKKRDKYDIILGYKNLDELTERAHKVAFRVTKAETLDLPPELDQTLEVALDATARRHYNELADDMVTELQGQEVTAENVLTSLLRLAQVTGGYITQKDAETEEKTVLPVSKSNAKLNALRETVGDLLDAGKKVLIFARFTEEIREISRTVCDMGKGFVKIDGSVPIKERGDLVDAFQTDPEVRVFIGQLRAVREGLTLTAADTAIFYSLDFSYADYSQARARIHRIGQKNACTYIHLVARGTVDERIHQALQDKKDMADLVVDNWKTLFGKVKP